MSETLENILCGLLVAALLLAPSVPWILYELRLARVNRRRVKRGKKPWHPPRVSQSSLDHYEQREAAESSSDPIINGLIGLGVSAAARKLMDSDSDSDRSSSRNNDDDNNFRGGGGSFGGGGASGDW